MQCLKNDSRLSRRASVIAQRFRLGIFFMLIKILAVAIRRIFKALRVETSFFKQRMCSRFSVSLPRQFRGCLKNDAICNQQPSAQRSGRSRSRIGQTKKRNKFSQWLNCESATFSRLCGERFTHKEVVYAHLFLVVLLAACCVAEWLEGGAL